MMMSCNHKGSAFAFDNTVLTKMVESGMYAIRPEIEFSGFSSFHQTEEELVFLESGQDEQVQPTLSGFPYYHDPGLPVCPFYSLPVFPDTPAKLNDFKEEIPAIFLKYELPPRNSSQTDEGWRFLDFLDQIQSSSVTWQFDNTNKVLHFGPLFRTIFMGIADILYAYHKRNLFSGDVIGRMRIHYDLRITHPYTPANTSDNDLDGRKVDIIHFRWLVAKVVRKFFGEDYESHLSKYFKLCFSELFLHSDGLERYYMFQYYHPVFYNDEDKYKLVHVLRDLQKRDVPYFSQHFGLNKPEYGYHCWWLSLAEENDESMLGGVYLYKDNNIKVYDNNPNSLPIFLRNCHEHYTGGTERKNKRTMYLNRQIEKENRVKIQIKNKKVQQRMRNRGQRGEHYTCGTETKIKNKEVQQRMRDRGQRDEHYTLGTETKIKNEEVQQRMRDRGQRDEQVQQRMRDRGQRDEHHTRGTETKIKNEEVQQRMRDRGQRDEHYTRCTETNIKRFRDHSQQIEKKNTEKIQKKNEEVQQRMCDRGQRDEHYTRGTETKIKNEEVQQRMRDRGQRDEHHTRGTEMKVKNEEVQQRMRDHGQRDEHHTRGTETNIKRFRDHSQQIEKKNTGKIQKKNEEVQQRTCDRGQRDEHYTRGTETKIKNEEVQQRMRDRGQRDKHHTRGTETNIKRFRDHSQQIEKKNREEIQKRNEEVQQRMHDRGQRDKHYTHGIETKIKNEEVQQRMRDRGQRAKLQPELKLTPRKGKIPLDQLPFHCELEFKITDRFPGIYACMIDSCIRGFNDNGERRFGCTLAQLLFEKSPFGCQQQQVGYPSHYFADGDCFFKERPRRKNVGRKCDDETCKFTMLRNSWHA